MTEERTWRVRYAAWLPVARTYMVVSLLGHLAWEVLQLPLYAIFWNEPPEYVAFAVLHCTVGDVLISVAAIMIAVMLMSRTDTIARRHYVQMAVVTVLLGVAYTVFSEWLNVSIRESWSYTDAMPLLPVLGTGVAPLLQWVIVPTIALSVAWRRTGRIGLDERT